VRRVPHQPLHSDFLRAIRASGHSLRTLAALADFTAYQNLWPFLNREPVPVSALNRDRFYKLAVAISYDGPIFKESR
jgi:hypothetical protein